MTAGAGAGAGTRTQVLAVAGALDTAAALRWLGAHTSPGVDLVDGGSYRRTTSDGVLVVEPVLGPLTGAPDGPGGPNGPGGTGGPDGIGRRRGPHRPGRSGAVVVRVSVCPTGSGRPRPPTAAEVGQVRGALDVDRDIGEVQAALSRDPVLAALVAARPGLRVMGGWSPWESLVRVVLGQQVSVAGARTLAGRLVRVAGHPLDGAGPGLDRLFPGPAELAAADLGPVGLTGARRRTLEGLARAVVDGRLALGPPEHPAGGPGWLDDLARQPGVGPWTLAYLSMRVLRDPDAWPAGDLVLRRACERYGLDARAGVQHLRPWRAYAATHLWEATWGAAAAAG